jgi:hypothetical protein
VHREPRRTRWCTDASTIIVATMNRTGNSPGARATRVGRTKIKLLVSTNPTIIMLWTNWKN